MKNGFQKAMCIAWLFLLLIGTGCSKKKYTYFFDRYQSPVKKDTVVVEEPSVFFASVDTVSPAVFIIETPAKKDTVPSPTPIQITQKKKRPAAIIGFTSAVLSVPAALYAGVLTGIPFAILFAAAIVLSVIGLKSDRKKLAKAGIWILIGMSALWLILIIAVLISFIFPKE